MGKEIFTRLLVCGVVAVAFAIKCQQPISKEECMRIKVNCLEINPWQCMAEGGKFIPRGGFCGYCDLCAKPVGERRRCNVTVPGTSIVTAICKRHYVCSSRSNGVCVRPWQCNQYD